MLKIVAVVNNRKTLFLGLSKVNTSRLLDGKPSVIDVQALVAGAEPVQDIVLCAGETDKVVYDELAQYIDLPPYREPRPDETIIHRQ